MPETQESRWENRDFHSPKSDFLCSKFDFLQRLSDFQEIRENLLERLSDFFNGFPLSSTQFKFSIFLNGFPDFSQWLSTFQEIRENLSTAANIQKIAIQASFFPLEIAIFRDKILQPKLRYSAIKYSAVRIQKIAIRASYFPLRAS